MKVRGTRAALNVLPVLMLVAGMTLSMLCGRHIPPDRPVIVAGPVEGSINVNYAFTATAVSPEGDSIAIRFAWGDGDTSDWSGYVASGEEVTMGRTWADTGAYHVKAQARTPAATESDWSEPYAVSVVIFAPGTLKWRFRTTGWCVSPPAIGADGTIYAGTSSSLYSINPNGTLKWRARWPSSLPAVADDGTVHFGSDDSCLYALNPDGALKWRYRTDGRVGHALAVAEDGTVYVGADSYLDAVNPDGTPKWRFETEGEITSSSPAIAPDGAIYFGSLDGHLYALNPDGTLKWRYRTATGPGNTSSPAIAADGTIYFGSGDWRVYALNPDGTLRWRSEPSGYPVGSSPAIAPDGTVYIGVLPHLCAFDPDGNLKWRFGTRGGVLGSNERPAVAADGTVYVEADHLYALNPDGTLRWVHSNTDGFSGSPAIGADGTVYFAVNDYLYAVQGSSPLADSPWPKFRGDMRNTGRVRRP